MFQRLKQNNFLIIGRAGLDLYADPPGTEIENATNFSAALGGSAANIAVAIARQGGNSALLTTVSDDAVGRYTLKALRSYGVDTRFIKSAGGEARNSLAIVETRPTNCQSVIYRNGVADFEITGSEAVAIDYSRFAALIVTGTALAREPSRTATLKAMTLARTAGLVLVIDVDFRPYSWKSKSEASLVCLEAAELCDIIVGNDEEFAILDGTGEGLELAARLGRQPEHLVVYKMGEKGSITFAGETRIDTPIFKVSALKPTGAGDAFMGGLVSGLVAGEPLPGALLRGAATAAIVVTRVGCAPAMPNAAEIHSFLQRHTS